MGAPHLGRQTLFFLEKLTTFLVTTVCQLSVLQCHLYLFSSEKLETLLITVAFFISLVHSGVAYYFRHVLCCKQFTAPLVEALFCGGPCLAEHAEHA